MNLQERFWAVMNFRPFDRLPMIEWAHWWNKTVDRWKGEGLPSGLTDRYELMRFFGLDVHYQAWYRSEAKGCPRPASHGSGIISSMEEYEAARSYLFPDPVLDEAAGSEKWSPPVKAPELEAWQREREGGEALVWFTVEGFFWYARKLLGIENHLYAFYDQEELLHRINEELADWMLKLIDRICAACQPDFMTFAEDMSYNNGPMLSKDHFYVFMKPYYDRVVPELKKRGILALVDSDGDITTPAQWFEEAGLDGILPLEKQAGVDIARLRKERPRMRFVGHFDKMVMDRGEEALRREFERLLPTAARGGFIVSCDHQTPPAVSLEDYRLYLSLFREYAEKAGRMSREMAIADCQ